MTATASSSAAPIAGAGTPPTPEAWAAAFAAAAPYRQFLDEHATPEQRARWDACHDRVVLTADQERLLAGFVRRMPVLVLAGAWCGDQRVPVAAFLSEDFTPVLYYGDRTLSAYRAAAAAQLGAGCATGIVPPPAEQLAAVTAEWLGQFERVQLILRLSGRLRQLHGET